MSWFSKLSPLENIAIFNRYFCFMSTIIAIMIICSENAWPLESCDKSNRSKFDECFGTITYNNGDHYSGTFKSKKRNGNGIYSFGKNSQWFGDKYSGSWLNGKRDGDGSYYYSNGNIYVGNWSNDQKHGFGRYFWRNGDRYSGNYKNNKVSGNGVMFWGVNSKWSGDRYIGQWKEGRRSGVGIYVYKNGRVTLCNYVLNKAIKCSKKGTFDNIFPLLKKKFMSYNGKTRRDVLMTLKKSLGHLNFKSKSDWNGNNFSWFVEFSMANFNILDLSSEENVNKVIDFLNISNNQVVSDKNRNPNTVKEKLFLQSSGTGFFVSKLGHVVTNKHVISECERVTVTYNQLTEQVKILAENAQHDLALLKVNNNAPYVFRFSDTDPSLMQDIYVAGFPFAESIGSTIKVTKGIISSLEGLSKKSQIQIDAAIQPGNSGGPIYDEFGNILGVAVAKLGIKKIIENFGVVPENVNFGIKASVVKHFLDMLKINYEGQNSLKIKKNVLGKNVTRGTVYISCYRSH